MTQTTSRSPSSPAITIGAVLVCGFVAVSLNTRVAFGQVGPLAPLGEFSSTAVTILGVLPPALMGICAPLTPLARRRWGDDRTLVIASVILLLGCILRPFGLGGLFVGTAIAAGATSLINVVIPVVVRTRFPASATGVMMGVYAVCMGMGSAIVAALMVPVARATGSWEPAIAVAIVPALLALLAIAPQWRHHTPVVTGAPVRHQPHRSAVGWSLLCFFGIQTLLFYTALAWLSTILVAGGTSASTAGIAQSLYIIGIGVGGFIAPTLAGRRSEHRVHILGTIGVCAVGLVGIMFTHNTAAVIASFILGAGFGAGQSLPGVLYAHRGKTPDRIAALSTFAQTGGYLIAATGPLLATGLHAATGSWNASVIAMLVLLVINAVFAQRAGHDGANNDQGPADQRATEVRPVASSSTNAS